MLKRKGSLLRQLTLSLGLAIIFLSLSSFYYQYQIERRVLTDNIRENLERQAWLLRSRLSQAETDAQLLDIARQYAEAIEYMDEAGHAVLIVDGEGEVLAGTGGLRPNDPMVGLALSQEDDTPVVREIKGDIQLALAFPVDPLSSDRAGALMMKHPLTPVATLADRLMLSTFSLVAITLLAMIFVVHMVLRYKVHQPLHTLWMHEYRIREGDLARIEGPDPNNEFSDLYSMYNEMVVRIAEQKRAIIEQKDHAALGDLTRNAVDRLTGPLDEILSKSQTLLEQESSLSDEDRTLLREIITNITRIARELKSIVVEGDKSSMWLEQEAGAVPDFDTPNDEPKDRQ